jgi:hypothetical protein
VGRDTSGFLWLDTPAIVIPTGMTFVPTELWSGLPLTLVLAVIGMSISVLVFIILGQYFGAYWLNDATGMRIFAISGDGMTFAGDMRSPEGIRQGFVATIPAPAGFVVFATSALLFSRRWRGLA